MLLSIGITISPWPSAIIAFSLNVGGYAAEVIRAAILSVPKGQWEAGHTMGVSRRQSLFRIILPQAARVSVPPLSNTFISLVKDTSLASLILVTELFRQAQQEFMLLYLEAAVMMFQHYNLSARRRRAAAACRNCARPGPQAAAPAFRRADVGPGPETGGGRPDCYQGVGGRGLDHGGVTHELAFARQVADVVIFMDGGVVVERGHPGTVLRDPREERTRQFVDRLLNPF